MPQVPLPRVELSPAATPGYGGVPSVVAPGDVAGKQIQQFGAALTQAGQATSQIASIFQDEENLAETKKQYNLWSETLSKKMKDGDTAYLNLIGEDAVGQAREDAIEEMEKLTEEMAKGMKTDASRGMFREAVGRPWIAAKDKIYGWEATQRRVWLRGGTASGVNNAGKQAIDDFAFGDTDPDISKAGQAASQQKGIGALAAPPVGAAAATRAGAVSAAGPAAPSAKKPTPSWRVQYNTAVELTKDLAEMDGVDERTEKEMVLKTKTFINAGIVERLLELGRTADAKDFLGGIKREDIDQGVASKLNETIKRISKGEKVTKIAYEISSGSYIKRAPPGTLRAATATAAQAEEIVDQIADVFLDDPNLAALIGMSPIGIVGSVREELKGLLARMSPAELAPVLQDPRVVAALEKAALEAQDLNAQLKAANQNPGGPTVTADTSINLKSQLREVKRRFEAGKIDAEERLLIERSLEELTVRQIKATSIEHNDVLSEVQEIFSQNKASGTGATTFDSPEFRLNHPTVFAKVIEFGLMEQAQRLAVGAMERVTDPEVYDQLWRDYNDGLLGKMSNAQFENKYLAFLGPVQAGEARRLRGTQQQPTKPPKDDALWSRNNQVKQLLGPDGFKLLSRVTPDGSIAPDPSKNLPSSMKDLQGNAISETTFWRQFQAELQRQVNETYGSAANATTDQVLDIARRMVENKVYATAEDSGWPEAGSHAIGGGAGAAVAGPPGFIVGTLAARGLHEIAEWLFSADEYAMFGWQLREARADPKHPDHEKSKRTHVWVDGRQVPIDGPIVLSIPAFAVEAIIWQGRLEVAEIMAARPGGHLTPKDLDDLKVKMRKAGSNSTDIKKMSPDTIHEALNAAGIPVVIPSHKEQLVLWDDMKREEPWKSLPPEHMASYQLPGIPKRE